MANIRTDVIAEIREDAFEFLNVLRKTGACNMFGAGPYLEEAFSEHDLTRHEARTLLTDWMQNFRG